MGNGFACALREEGEVVCWGVNYANQLGDLGQKSVEEPSTFSLGDEPY